MGPIRLNSIPGSDGIMKLIKQELPEMDIKTNGFLDSLFMKGSYDLTLTTKLAEIKKKMHPQVEYEFPHIVVYPEQGSIESVLAKNEYATIIEATSKAVFVKGQSYTGDASDKITSHNSYFEAIIEIRYKNGE